MRHRILVLTVALLIPFLLPSHAASQDPAELPEKNLYKPNGSESTVIGAITVNGVIPKPLRVDMSADPVCIQLNRRPEAPSHPPELDALIVTDGGLVNAFVYIKSGASLETYRFEQPDSEIVLQHKNCNYPPKVIGLRVGQRLSIANVDPMHHNVHPTPKYNAEWNQTLPPGSPPLVKMFKRPEVLIPFKCNQHPWERAYVAVMDHPFFAVSDGFGNYEIRGLPPGQYTLVVWHATLGEQQVELTVGAGEFRRVDFSLKAPEKR